MSNIAIKTLLSAAFVLSGLMPAAALPTMPFVTAIEQPAAQRADVIEVKKKHRKHGYRVYRKKRHVPRHYNGHKPRHMSRRHVNYCYNRYRSYREYDNTYQPYHGGRRLCRSPY
ncbi:BA14K-like protein [Hoeflea sp. IMCC20628]|uniref:BA14K family protein n=1 Tax=Hoeflea sp. IMCC20628 TaxID=1620421 RepID=UPI00063ABA01|nr:BA14K family protein [Hoeflea sp. IMCC20628]AKI01335.1 BA14K-like protein [Hoeflea sp. IMCC20628]